MKSYLVTDCDVRSKLEKLLKIKTKYPLGYKAGSNDICGRLSRLSNLKMRTNNKHKVITSSCNETPSVSSTKPHNSSALTTSKGDEDKNSKVKQVCNKETIRLKRKRDLQEKVKMYQDELQDIDSNSGKFYHL